MAQIPAPFTLTANDVIAAAQARWQCNVPTFTTFTSSQSAAASALAGSAAPGANVAAAASVLLSSLAATAYTTGNAAVNAAAGSVYADSTCLVNAVLSMASPAHRAVLPVDTPLNPPYASSAPYAWPLVPRSPGMAAFFTGLGAGMALSQMWGSVPSAAAALPGDVLATTLALGPGDVGFAGIVMGAPVVVASGVTVPTGGNVVAAAGNPYTLVDVRVLSSVPAGWVPAAGGASPRGYTNDTRLAPIPASGAPPPLQGVGASLVRLYVDAQGRTAGIDFVNGGGPATAMAPLFPGTAAGVGIGIGRPLAPPPALAQPSIASASFCDALQNQSLNVVVALPPASASDPAYVYVLSAAGNALREISPFGLSSAAPVTIACGDVLPSLPGAEVIAFAEDLGPGTQGLVIAVNALTGASQTLFRAPFAGPARLAAADVDGDGFMDILISPAGPVAGGVGAGEGVLFLFRFDPSLGLGNGFDNGVTTSLNTGWANGVDVSAAPLLQLDTPPLPLASPFISSAAATAAAGGANPNASMILTVPHGATLSPALQAWGWDPDTQTLVPAPGRALLALPSAAYAAGGAVVAALGVTWMDGYAAIGSASSLSSNISYVDVFAWALVGLAPPPTAIPGPHVLASGGTLWPAPLSPAAVAATCPGYSTLSTGPTAGVFFIGTAGVGGEGMWMHTTSHSWTRLGFDIASPSGGFGAALSGAAVGAVTTIFPALAPANNYMSTYSIATLSAGLGDLLYDWNTWPRNDSTAWAYVNVNKQWPVNFSSNGPAMPLTGPNSKLGVWNTQNPADWFTGPPPAASTCIQPYGPAAMLFPPVAPVNNSASTFALRSTATWRRERQIATAYYFAHLGLGYQHVHVPGFVSQNRGSDNFNYVSAARWAPGVDCSDFSSWTADWANGLTLITAVGQQDTWDQAVLFQGTMNASGAPDPLPVPGHYPIASIGYAVTVATAPMPYAELISILKPGDFIGIAGGGPSQPPTHVVQYLGKAGLGAGVGLGSDYPLILDSTDTQFAPDQNGCLAPPGPHLREFRPGEWYANMWSSAHRWYQDEDDVAAFFAGNAAAIDPLTRVALLPPPALTPNTFTCVPGVTPSRACAAHLPPAFDPRGTPCYAAKNSAAVLAQGSCSASYAFAAASLLSTNLCLAGGSLSAVGTFNYAQVSPAYTMSVATALGGIARPCAGGHAMAHVLQPLAAWQAYASAAAGTGSGPAAGSAPVPLTTCSLTYGVAPGSDPTAKPTTTPQIIPCAGGCAPYSWFDCQGAPPFAAGGGPNASAAARAWDAAHALQCPVLPGADGVAATGTAGLLSCFTPPGPSATPTLPSPPAIDAASAAAAAAFALFNASANYLPVSGGALTSSPSLLAWSAADVATVKSYTVGAGSVVVRMSACPAWRAWMQGCAGGSSYSAALRMCSSPVPLPGFAFARAANAFLAAPNASLPLAAYAGPSCVPGTWTHSALIVGYGPAPVGGGDAFILQNSWGAAWGDGGYFYLSTATAGSGRAANGGVGLSYPGTMVLTPTPATLASFNGSLPAPGSAAASPATFAAPAVAQSLAAFIGSNYSAPIPDNGGGGGGVTPGANSSASPVTGPAAVQYASEFVALLNLLYTSGSAANALTGFPDGEINSTGVLVAVNAVTAAPVQGGTTIAVNVTVANLPLQLATGAPLPPITQAYVITGSMLAPDGGGAAPLSSLWASFWDPVTYPTPAPTPDPWQTKYEQAKDAAIGLGVVLGLLLLFAAYAGWQATADRRRMRRYERTRAAAVAAAAAADAAAKAKAAAVPATAVAVTAASASPASASASHTHTHTHTGAALLTPSGATATAGGGFYYTHPNPTARPTAAAAARPGTGATV